MNRLTKILRQLALQIERFEFSEVLYAKVVREASYKKVWP